MDFAEYQQKLAALEHERGWDRVLPSHTFLHLGEELGEIGRIVQCLEGYRGTELDRQALCAQLSGELADLIGLLFKLASQHDIDMDRAMQAHLDKFVARFPDIERGRQEMTRYIAYQKENLAWVQGREPREKTEGDK